MLVALLKAKFNYFSLKYLTKPEIKFSEIKHNSNIEEKIVLRTNFDFLPFHYKLKL